MDRVDYLAVTHLPGGGPVAITERDGHVMVYMSEAHSVAQIVAGMNAMSATETMRDIRAGSALALIALRGD